MQLNFTNWHLFHPKKIIHFFILIYYSIPFSCIKKSKTINSLGFKILFMGISTMEPKEFWEDKEWAIEHYIELQKQYMDKWVAIVDKKVVSSGENLGDVEKHAAKKTGKKYIALIYVESGAVFY